MILEVVAGMHLVARQQLVDRHLVEAGQALLFRAQVTFGRLELLDAVAEHLDR